MQLNFLHLKAYHVEFAVNTVHLKIFAFCFYLCFILHPSLFGIGVVQADTDLTTHFSLVIQDVMIEREYCCISLYIVVQENPA